MWLAILRLPKIIKDIILYSKYCQIVKLESQNSPVWAKLKLRLDWFKRIYTIVNLPPEVTMSRDFPVASRPAYVFEEMHPANDYLTKLNLQELIVPSMRPVKHTNDESYLYYYSFLFRNFTWWWLIRFIGEIITIIYLYRNWTPITEFIIGMFSWI